MNPASIAYGGVTSDHLYLNCPGLLRWQNSHANRHSDPYIGKPLFGLVDVDGSDLCGWCVRVYKARNR